MYVLCLISPHQPSAGQRGCLFGGGEGSCVCPWAAQHHCQTAFAGVGSWLRPGEAHLSCHFRQNRQHRTYQGQIGCGAVVLPRQWIDPRSDYWCAVRTSMASTVPPAAGVLAGPAMAAVGAAATCHPSYAPRRQVAQTGHTRPESATWSRKATTSFPVTLSSVDHWMSSTTAAADVGR